MGKLGFAVAVVLICLVFCASSTRAEVSEDVLFSINKGIAVIDSWQMPNGGWPGWEIPHYGGEWWNVSSTGYCIRAIIDASLIGVESSSALGEARDYIVGQQGPSGRWPGEHEYRGTRDALLGLITLNEPKTSPPIQKGVEWLRSELVPLGHWEDGSGSIYTHAEVLASFALATSQSDPDVQNALSYLIGKQGSDGSFFDVNYPRRISTTVLSLLALLECGELPSSEIVAKTVAYIVAAQNTDGGWSETEQGGLTDPFTTADAIIALLKAGLDPNSETVEKGISHVVSSQESNGSWSPLGTYYVESTTARSVQALALYYAQLFPSTAVGGYWVPMNDFDLLSPLIALVSVSVICATALVYVKRKMKQ